jgi:hypothetical protein
MVEMNQVTQHMVDLSFPFRPLEAIVNLGPIHITKSIN